MPDYADSELPLLGPLADVNSSFKLDFVAGQCINKHNKLVPYKTSGVRVDEIKAECTRRRRSWREDYDMDFDTVRDAAADESAAQRWRMEVSTTGAAQR